MLRKLLLLLVTVAFVVGNSHAAQLKGSVFIVTNSGMGLKLPLARVYLLNATEHEALQKGLDEQIQRIEKEYSSRFKVLEQRVEELTKMQDADLSAARAEAVRRQKSYHERRSKTIAALSTPPPQRQKFKTAAEFDAAIAAWEAAKNDWPPAGDAHAMQTFEGIVQRHQFEKERARRRIDDDGASLLAWKKGELQKILSADPQLQRAAITDADGAFSAELKQDTAFVLIIASRAIPSEHYRWMLPAEELRQQSGVVLFSNHNMTP